MTTIRELCDNDPAVAIKHMIDGLINHKDIKDFKLDFDSSEWINGIYFGGAATVTLVQILDMSFAPIELRNVFTRADLIQTNRLDLSAFEEAIKLFSQGSLAAIERYFDLPTHIIPLPWNLRNENWERDLPKVINFWQKLTERGIN